MAAAAKKAKSRVPNYLSHHLTTDESSNVASFVARTSVPDKAKVHA